MTDKRTSSATMNLEVLIHRIQEGDTAAVAPLIQGTYRSMRAYAAAFSATTTMGGVAVAKAWAQALPGITLASSASFGSWMRGLVRESLSPELSEADRLAIENKDALSHVLCRAGLDSLQTESAHDLAAEVANRLAALPVPVRALVQNRYADRMSFESLASAAGSDERMVHTELFLFRAELIEGREAGQAVLAGDSLFALLVDEYLAGSALAQTRQILARSVTNDLAACDAFEKQVHVEMVLDALLSPAITQAGQHLAVQLSTEPPTERQVAIAEGRGSNSGQHTAVITGRHRSISSGRIEVVGQTTTTTLRRRGSGQHRSNARSGGSGWRSAARGQSSDASGLIWTLVGGGLIVAGLLTAFLFNSHRTKNQDRRKPEVAAPTSADDKKQAVEQPRSPDGAPAAPSP